MSRDEKFSNCIPKKKAVNFSENKIHMFMKGTIIVNEDSKVLNIKVINRNFIYEENCTGSCDQSAISRI